jgi:hypothetical protein
MATIKSANELRLPAIILLLAIKGSNEIVDPISTMKTTENKLKTLFVN